VGEDGAASGVGDEGSTDGVGDIASVLAAAIVGGATVRSL
jgi:hypothetical protein